MACARAAAAYAGALFALAAPNMHVEALLTRPWRNSTDCCWGRCRREGNFIIGVSLTRRFSRADRLAPTLILKLSQAQRIREARLEARRRELGAQAAERKAEKGEYRLAGNTAESHADAYVRVCVWIIYIDFDFKLLRGKGSKEIAHRGVPGLIC